MGPLRVADRTRELEALSDQRFGAAYEQELERVLLELFGACPDCGDDAWDEVAEAFDREVGRDRAAAFCLERGFDLRREDGELVEGWRDVGIMVLARERGLVP